MKSANSLTVFIVCNGRHPARHHVTGPMHVQRRMQALAIDRAIYPRHPIRHALHAGRCTRFRSWHFRRIAPQPTSGERENLALVHLNQVRQMQPNTLLIAAHECPLLISGRS